MTRHFQFNDTELYQAEVLDDGSQPSDWLALLFSSGVSMLSTCLLSFVLAS